MRESVGGAMQMYVVMFILFVFIMFLASVVQYARVYKIKNTIINEIEKNEGIPSIAWLASTDRNNPGLLKSEGYSIDNGYEVCKHSFGDRGAYYNIELYATFSFLSLKIEVPIKGETRLIETGTLINSEENNDPFATSSCITN